MMQAKYEADKKRMRLEKELEVHLFDRSPKGYSLNDDGYKLLPFAENIETKINSIYQSISGTDTVLTGTVRMAVPEGLGIGIISKYIICTGLQPFIE